MLEQFSSLFYQLLVWTQIPPYVCLAFTLADCHNPEAHGQCRDQGFPFPHPYPHRASSLDTSGGAKHPKPRTQNSRLRFLTEAETQRTPRLQVSSKILQRHPDRGRTGSPPLPRAL